jgi:predicted DNA-binding protein (MmcQ/YjbR family)
MSRSLKTAESALRKCAIGYPETTEDFPWGHRAIKVKGKTFLFMSLFKQTLSLSVKLPVSGRMALQLPFASSTKYSLGKSGWVTASFEPGDTVPVEMLMEWIDESFRAIAPKRVLAALESQDSGGRSRVAAPKSKRRPR